MKLQKTEMTTKRNENCRQKHKRCICNEAANGPEHDARREKQLNWLSDKLTG